MKKVIAYVLYNYFATHLPGTGSILFGRTCRKIRGFLFNMYTGNTGKNINVQRKTVFSSKVRMGDNSGIGMNSNVQGPTTIGSNVMIGQELIVYTRNHNTADINIPMIKQSFAPVKDVIIEDDVWIGSRVTIMPGVTVGKGSIIGASAVVTKDVPRYSVVGGVPAKVLKYRNESKTLEKV